MSDDFDSQANLSTCFGIEDVTAVPVTIGNLMLSQMEEEELPDRAEYIQSKNGVDFDCILTLRQNNILTQCQNSRNINPDQELTQCQNENGGAYYE